MRLDKTHRTFKSLVVSPFTAILLAASGVLIRSLLIIRLPIRKFLKVWPNVRQRCYWNIHWMRDLHHNQSLLSLPRHIWFIDRFLLLLIDLKRGANISNGDPCPLITDLSTDFERWNCPCILFMIHTTIILNIEFEFNHVNNSF